MFIYFYLIDSYSVVHTVTQSRIMHTERGLHSWPVIHTPTQSRIMHTERGLHSWPAVHTATQSRILHTERGLHSWPVSGTASFIDTPFSIARVVAGLPEGWRIRCSY